MATITVQELGPYGEGFASITFTALTESPNDFVNDGQTILLVKNGTGASVITVTSIADPYGRTGDLVVNTGANSESMTGFLNTSLFDGTVSFTTDKTDSSVEVAAVRLKR